MNRYIFIHKQKFMGKILQGSFIKTIRNEHEIEETVRALYSDPHVFSVIYKALEEQPLNGTDVVQRIS